MRQRQNAGCEYDPSGELIGPGQDFEKGGTGLMHGPAESDDPVLMAAHDETMPFGRKWIVHQVSDFSGHGHRAAFGGSGGPRKFQSLRIPPDMGRMGMDDESQLRIDGIECGMGHGFRGGFKRTD